MYRITKTFTFEAAHRLSGPPEEHKCARTHGHSYRVEIVLESEQLTETGFVDDFAELKTLDDYAAPEFQTTPPASSKVATRDQGTERHRHGRFPRAPAHRVHHARGDDINALRSAPARGATQPRPPRSGPDFPATAAFPGRLPGPWPARRPVPVLRGGAPRDRATLICQPTSRVLPLAADKQAGNPTR